MVERRDEGDEGDGGDGRDGRNGSDGSDGRDGRDGKDETCPSSTWPRRIILRTAERHRSPSSWPLGVNAMHPCGGLTSPLDDLMGLLRHGSRDRGVPLQDQSGNGDFPSAINFRIPIPQPRPKPGSIQYATRVIGLVGAFHSRLLTCQPTSHDNGNGNDNGTDNNIEVIQKNSTDRKFIYLVLQYLISHQLVYRNFEISNSSYPSILISLLNSRVRYCTTCAYIDRTFRRSMEDLQEEEQSHRRNSDANRACRQYRSRSSVYRTSRNFSELETE
jgi:hypothetical protein